MNHFMGKFLLCIFVLCCLNSHSFAENRALIIGIAEYENVDGNMLEPLVDVQLMVGIASQLGFQDEQKRLLLNENATRENILQTIQTWLVDGVTSEDKIFLYYSGHGLLVMDDDNCYEAFIPYEGIGNNALSSNDISDVLSLSPAAEILTILDSGFVPSTFEYDKSTSPTSCYDLVDSMKQKDEKERVLMLQAASQGELAFGAMNSTTDRGSLFTQSLVAKLTNTDNITFEELIAAVETIMVEKFNDIIDNNNTRFSPPHPTIKGPTELRVQNIYTFASQSIERTDTSSTITLSQFIDNLQLNSSFEVRVTADKSTLRLGELLNLNIYSEESGYLYIYDYGVSGNLTLLSPNEFTPEPYPIRANETVRLPGASASFQLPAIEPVGASRIVAIVSSKKLSANQNLLCNYSVTFSFCSSSSSSNSNMATVEDVTEEIVSATNHTFGFGEEYVTVTY